MTDSERDHHEHEEIWRTILNEGHRSRVAFLPGSPRCAMCLIPMGGVAGPVMKLANRGPSRKNPGMCNF